MLIGMVHAGATPGSPRSRRGVRALAEQAAAEAAILVAAGFDGVIVENMHDAPYVNGPHDPATTAAMTRCVHAVRERVPDATLGVQVLSRGEREALAIAHACGAQFVRCENFVFAHVADEGLMAQAAAGPLLRYRQAIGASTIKVYADIQKKHASHALTADLTLADWAKGAEFFGADGVIVTGAATGQATDPEDVRTVRTATKLPVLVGSGVTPADARSLLQNADALIVGSWIKKGGDWKNPVDAERAKRLVHAVRGARR
jgi:hypothetical protein